MIVAFQQIVEQMGETNIVRLCEWDSGVVADNLLWAHRWDSGICSV